MIFINKIIIIYMNLDFFIVLKIKIFNYKLNFNINE